MTNLDSTFKSRDITWLTKVHNNQSYGFSSSHVRMWELDYKEGWAPKNWFFWIVVLEKSLRNPLDCKEIKPVHPKGSQSWVVTGRTDAEDEAPVLWPPDARNWLVEKTLMLGKTEGRRRRWQRMKCLDSITDSNRLSKPWEIVEDRGAQHTAVHGVAKRQTQLSDWGTTTLFYLIRSCWTHVEWSSFPDQPLLRALKLPFKTRKNKKHEPRQHDAEECKQCECCKQTAKKLPF